MTEEEQKLLDGNRSKLVSSLKHELQNMQPTAVHKFCKSCGQQVRSKQYVKRQKESIDRYDQHLLGERKKLEKSIKKLEDKSDNDQRS